MYIIDAKSHKNIFTISSNIKYMYDLRPKQKTKNRMVRHLIHYHKNSLLFKCKGFFRLVNFPALGESL